MVTQGGREGADKSTPRGIEGCRRTRADKPFTFQKVVVIKKKSVGEKLSFFFSDHPAIKIVFVSFFAL